MPASQKAFTNTSPGSAQSLAIDITSLPSPTNLLPPASPTESAELSLSAAPTLQPLPGVTAPVMSPGRTQAARPVQPQVQTQTQTMQPAPAPAEQSVVPPSQSQPPPDAEPLSSPASSPPPDTSLEHGTVVRLGNDFPNLAGAQSGCYGLENCQQVSGNFRQAAQQLIAQMEGQGYQLTEREDLDNTGHRVFEVIDPDAPNATYYLNVFSPDIGSAVYVLTVNILSLEELKQLKGGSGRVNS
ncbi:MAG: hypothetical protein WA885_05020 [Phormidesmis sp.]